MTMSAHDAAAQLGRMCGEECFVVNDRGRLVVTAPDAKTAREIQDQVGGEYEGYTVTVRTRATSGIRRVVATVVQPPA